MTPLLETPRLTLGAHSRGGFEAFRATQTSDRMQFGDGRLTNMEAWNAYTSEAGSWVIDGIGYWTVTRKDTGEPVAFVGLLHPPHFPEIELGWMTTAEGEGKGYAFEAARAARDWAFGPRGLDTLVSYIDPANVRSIRLAERLGATIDMDARDPGDGGLVYRHASPRGQA